MDSSILKTFLINHLTIAIISDEKYSEELQFQEGLMSPAAGARRTNESQMGDSHIQTRSRTKIKGKRMETGESSQSFCQICMDKKPHEEMFAGNSCCGHRFCTDCTAQYISAKVEENIAMVKCPDPKCKEMLDPHRCRSIIPKQVFDRWGDALCESSIKGSEKLFCPFKDCSALLINDGDKALITSECPSCRRLFCARCEVEWHEGFGCREYQNLRKDERGRGDIMVMELAATKQWRRCPSYRFYVEKTAGCPHITCMCSFQFCYVCGNPWQNHSCIINSPNL